MKFGLTPWLLRDTATAQQFANQACQAEAWGYQSFWLPEHHFTNGTAIPDPLLLLASVAAVTRKLRLGTTSYLLPLRNPVLAAEQVAVLDQLSAGRVILGIGRGFAPQLFATFNIAPSKKRRLFRENLRKMQAAWRGESVLGENDDDIVSISPLPHQKPHPPIWVAAFGPLALKQAGSLGLPYLASPMETYARLKDNYARHRAASNSAGVTEVLETPIMRSIFCSESKSLVARVRDRLDSETRQMVRADAAIDSQPSCDDWAIVGDRAFVADRIARYRDDIGMTYLIATRLRIGGVQSVDLERSVASVAAICAA